MTLSRTDTAASSWTVHALYALWIGGLVGGTALVPACSSTSSNAGPDSGTGAGTDTGGPSVDSGTGSDSGTGMGVDSAAGMGVESGTGMSVDSDTGLGVDAGMGPGVCGQPVSRPTFGSSGKLVMVASSQGDTFGAVFANGAWSGQMDFPSIAEVAYASISVVPDGAGGAIAAMPTPPDDDLVYATYSAAGAWLAFQPIMDGQGNQQTGISPTVSSFGSSAGLLWASYGAGMPAPPLYATRSGSGWTIGPSLTQESSYSAAIAMTSYGATAAYTTAEQGLVMQDLCGTSWGSQVTATPQQPGQFIDASIQIVNLSGSGPDMLVVLEDGTGAPYFTTRTGTTWTPLAIVDSTYHSEGTPRDTLALAGLPNGGAILAFSGLPSGSTVSNESIYAYLWQNGQWGPASIIANGAMANTQWASVGNLSGVAPGVGGDVAELVFTGNSGAGNLQPFHTRLQGTTWSTPQLIAPPAGSTADYYHAALAAP
jgi:hypothetical protein